MRPFMDFQHYILDLYGTLVSIHTDERQPELWQWMADWYATYGADWTPAALARRYDRLVAQAEALLKRRSGCAYPEIRLEDVFLRLLKEAGRTHPAAEAPRGPEAEAAWARATANAFRVRSRAWLRPYPGAAALLEALRARGRRVYLLSNAQAVFTRPEIERCGLDGRFDDVWLSSDHGVKKPEPRFLGDLLAAHGMAADDAVMIGNDWAADMAVAAANGAWGFHVNSDRLSPARLRVERLRLAAQFSPEAAQRVAEAASIAQLAREANAHPLC